MTSSVPGPAIPDGAIEAAVAAMFREGGRLAEWHAWRCSYPLVYGECDCHREVIAAEIITAAYPSLRAVIEAEVRERVASEIARRERDAAVRYAATASSYDEGRRDAYDYAEQAARDAGGGR